MICNTMSVVSLTSACGCYVRVLIPVKYILYYLSNLVPQSVINV